MGGRKDIVAEHEIQVAFGGIVKEILWLGIYRCLLLTSKSIFKQAETPSCTELYEDHRVSPDDTLSRCSSL